MSERASECVCACMRECVRACVSVRACVCVRVCERESEDNLHVDSIGMNKGTSSTSSNSTGPRAPSS